jgi:transposase-like protein
MLESLPGVEADRVRHNEAGAGAGFRLPPSDEARGFFLANTKERREMRTIHRTHEVAALREALAARLPATAPAAPQKHDELEERCRLYLRHLRWPGGVECPRCEEHDRLLWLDARDKWHCYSCRYQFSVTAGTLFHSSHLPLWKWFVSVQLMTETPHGISANRLRQILGGSYKTFWFTTHRIRVAMRGRGQPLLREVVGDFASRRRLAGPHHHLSEKYLSAYAEERRWLEANQDNPHVFRDTILALVRGEGLSYEQLVAAR